MKNYKSLQEGGIPDADNSKQLAAEIQNKVQNQMYDIEDAIVEMLQAGEDPNSVGVALMQLGYEEEDVIQLFKTLSQQQSAQQQPKEEVAEVQQMAQDAAPMQQQPMAKKGGSFKDWYKQLGGNTHNTYHGNLPKAQTGFPGTIDQTQFPGFTFGETTDYNPDFEDEYSANEVKGYLDFAKDLSDSNLVNKGSMGIQPSTGYEGPASQKVTAEMLKEQTPATDIVNAVSWVNKNLFSDDDPNRIYDMTIADNVYKAKKSPIRLGHKDVHRGIQQSGLTSPFTGYGQLGNEILNKMDDLTLMQYGGGNMPQIQQDNTKAIMPSVQDINMFTGYAADNPFTMQEQLNRIVNEKAKELSNYDLSNLTEEDLTNLQNMIIEQAKNELQKKKMGGTNSMYDFFMDNKLPIYQSMGEIPRPKTLGYLYDKYGMGKNNTINLGNVTDFNTRNKLAAINRAILERTGIDDVGETFSEKPKSKSRTYLPTLYSSGKPEVIYDRFGKPVINPETGEAIKGKNYSLDPESSVEYYQNQSFIKPKQRSNRPGRIDMKKYFGPNAKPVMSDQEWKAMQKAIRDPSAYGERKYGGQSYMDPFMSKRKLRKKKGGQIADIPTQILKKLMAKGGQFEIL